MTCHLEEIMARKANPSNTTVAVKLTPGQREAVENYRWKNRLEVSDVVRRGILALLTAEGEPIVEPDTEAPAEPVTEAPKSRK